MGPQTGIGQEGRAGAGRGGGAWLGTTTFHSSMLNSNLCPAPGRVTIVTLLG